MSTVSTRANIRTPEITDRPANIQIALGNAVDDIDRVCIPQYATVAARNAANLSPSTGFMCYVTDTATGGRTLQSYNGNGWVSYYHGTRFVAKSATTSRALTTTATDDPHLTLTVEANATYEFELVMFISGDTTGDVKYQFTHPTGSTAAWGKIAPGVSWGAGTGDGVLGSQGTAATGTSSGPMAGGCTAIGTPLINILRGILIVSSTSGSLTLQWAQNASSSNGTEIRISSYMLLTRIA